MATDLNPDRCLLCDGQEEVVATLRFVENPVDYLDGVVKTFFEPWRGGSHVKLVICPACSGRGRLTEAERGAFRIGGFHAVRELRKAPSLQSMPLDLWPRRPRADRLRR